MDNFAFIKHPVYTDLTPILLGDRVHLARMPRTIEGIITTYVVTGIREPHYYLVDDIWIYLRSATNDFHSRAVKPSEIVKADS